MSIKLTEQETGDAGRGVVAAGRDLIRFGRALVETYQPPEVLRDLAGELEVQARRLRLLSSQLGGVVGVGSR